MEAALADAASISSVPADRIVDFDMFAVKDPDGDLQRAWARLREGPEIFWTPRNGGHWVATRGDIIKEIQLDHEHFSMGNAGIPSGRRGIPSPPIDVDPPRHFGYRQLLSPFFSPKAIQQIEASIRELLDEIIERVAPRRECEFVSEVAQHLPIVVFLRLLDLPLDDREMLLRMGDAYSRASRVEETQAARVAMRDYVSGWIEKRRRAPGDDVLSGLVQAQVDSRPITDTELQGMCTLLMFGGLDTVKSFMGFVIRFLATHPDHLRQIVEEPTLIPHAVEELLRRHGVTNTARVITGDFIYRGLPFRKGQQILIPNLFYGIDPDVNDVAMNVDFSRPKPIKHAAFGSGPHTCPGAMLARTEVRLFLEYWTRAIPAFQIKPGTVPVAHASTTNSLRELHLVW